MKNCHRLFSSKKRLARRRGSEERDVCAGRMNMRMFDSIFARRARAAAVALALAAVAAVLLWPRRIFGATRL